VKGPWKGKKGSKVAVEKNRNFPPIVIVKKNEK
jgi:hypothetical protein